MQQNIIAEILFIIIIITTIYLFYKASNYSKSFLIIVCIWVFVQSILALKGFYINEHSTPPKFALLIVPPTVFIIILLITKRGRNFIDALNIQQLTLLHTIRVFVELVLYMLFIFKTVPKAMTFEGRNFDVLAGLSAPIIYYLVFKKQAFSKTGLIVWNIISLLLLLNIIVTAVLSLKTPFQVFGVEQPNIALTYFPYNLLAAAIVPIVLMSHFAALKQLISKSI